MDEGMAGPSPHQLGASLCNLESILKFHVVLSTTQT